MYAETASEDVVLLPADEDGRSPPLLPKVQFTVMLTLLAVLAAFFTSKALWRAS